MAELLELNSTLNIDRPKNKPHPLSLFWWRNYFSDNPSSLYNEPEVYYDEQGNLHQPSRRNVDYWTDVDCVVLHCCRPFSFRHHYSACYGSDLCLVEDGCQFLAIFIIAVSALVAAIVALSIVFNYPPVMIISWVILLIGSIGEGVVGKSPECVMIRIYNLVSAGFIAFYFAIVCFGVARLQKHYKGFYPGTPGIQVNYIGLISLFESCKKGYLYSMVPSAGLVLWGVANWVNFSTFGPCFWTTLTQIGWIFVHFLNLIAALGMFKRMNIKHGKLIHPPPYSLHPELHTPVTSLPQPHSGMLSTKPEFNSQ